MQGCACYRFELPPIAGEYNVDPTEGSDCFISTMLVHVSVANNVGDEDLERAKQLC